MNQRLAAAATLSLAATGLLAGCAATEPAAGEGATYADGEYEASGDYVSPAGPETVEVTLSLEDSVITEVEVVGLATDPQAKRYEEQFASGIAAEVVGKRIDSLNVSRVAGSSLTSGGFNAAIADIMDQARD